MKKRMLTLAAVLALALSLLTTALAADVTLTVKTPETIPKAGEEFTVTVDITGNPGFGSVGFAVAFDHDKLECTSIRAGELLAGVMTAVNPNAKDGAKLGAASATPIAGDGTLATLTFRVKEEIEAFDFSLVGADVSDVKGNTLFRSESPAKSAEPDEKPTTPTTPTKPATPEQPTQPEPQPQQSGAEAVTTDFTDVEPTFWGAKWIAEAAKRGLFKGTPDGRFQPDAPISRADYVLVLHRMAGEPEPRSAAPFPDVPENAYYAKAVAWAYEKGYVNGKGSGFAPTDSLTRQEAMKILFGYAGGQSGGELLLTSIYDSGFTDSGEIAAWAKPAMYWAYYKSIISGTSATTLSPTATATRAQLAKILVGYQDMKS